MNEFGQLYDRWRYVAARGCRALSTKTKIETMSRREACEEHIHITMRDALKQGLKLFCHLDFRTTLHGHMHDPLK